MFVDKLNKKQEGVYVLEEEKTIENGKWEGYLNHDNVNQDTIYIYTEEKFNGDKVEDYFTSTSEEMPWKLYLKVFSKSEKIYITYESTGDQVEAEDVNLIQDVISATKEDLEGYKDSNDKEVSDLKNNKVDKIEGKGLSTENYTTNDKDKLSKIEPGSNKYTHPDIHSANMITENSSKRFVSEIEKAKWNKVEEKADKIYVDRTFATKEEIGESGQGDMKKSVYDTNNNGVIDKADSVPWAGVTGKPDGSTTAKGVVQLSNSVTSTSQSLAATPYAVKQVMDKADQAFQSASDGKKRVATAITGKGVPTSSSDTFSKMANNIDSIQVGMPLPYDLDEIGVVLPTKRDIRGLDVFVNDNRVICYFGDESISNPPYSVQIYDLKGTLLKEMKDIISEGTASGHLRYRSGFESFGISEGKYSGDNVSIYDLNGTIIKREIPNVHLTFKSGYYYRYEDGIYNNSDTKIISTRDYGSPSYRYRNGIILTTKGGGEPKAHLSVDNSHTNFVLNEYLGFYPM